MAEPRQSSEEGTLAPGCSAVLAFRFELFSRALLVEVTSDRAELVGRIARCYERHSLVRDSECWQPDLGLVLRSSGRVVHVGSPWERWVISCGEERTQVEWFRREAPEAGGPLDRRLLNGSLGREGGHDAVRHINGVAETTLLRALVLADAPAEAFHAAGAVCGEQSVLLVGRSGRGKTTTLLGLCARGWRVFADDVVFLHLGTGDATSVQRRVTYRGKEELRCSRYLEPAACSTASEDGAQNAYFKPQYRAAGLRRKITDVVFLEGIGQAPRIERLSGHLPLLKLSRASYSVTELAVDRLQAYTGCLQHVRWWACHAGEADATAAALSEALRRVT